MAELIRLTDLGRAVGSYYPVNDLDAWDSWGVQRFVLSNYGPQDLATLADWRNSIDRTATHDDTGHVEQNIENGWLEQEEET